MGLGLVFGVAEGTSLRKCSESSTFVKTLGAGGETVLFKREACVCPAEFSSVERVQPLDSFPKEREDKIPILCFYGTNTELTVEFLSGNENTCASALSPVSLPVRLWPRGGVHVSRPSAMRVLCHFSRQLGAWSFESFYLSSASILKQCSSFLPDYYVDTCTQ